MLLHRLDIVLGMGALSTQPGPRTLCISILNFAEIGAFEDKIRMSANLRKRGLFWAK